MTQFGKLSRPLAGAPRGGFAGPLGLRSLKGPALAKCLEIDRAFVDIATRLDHLEQADAVAKAVKPKAEGARP